METKQLVLKRTLETINEDLDVVGLDNRLRLQKAVYLVQAAGADLGYTYSWYIKGPYSTGLTQDYFALAENSQDDDQRNLSTAFTDKVREAAKVLLKPKKLTAQKHEWYELLASLHFMRTQEKISEANLPKMIEQRKPHLAGFTNEGIQHLKTHALI
jgi:uncharacterized protein YwgA